MSHNAPKRGRPTGTSQFPQDRAALERMHVLCEQAMTAYQPMTAYKAAEKVVAEMALSELSGKQTIDRLRKKYPKFLEEKLAAAKKEEALRSTTPTPKPQNGPSQDDWDRFRRHQEHLETPAGRPAKELLIRLSRGDQDLIRQIRQAEEGARLFRTLTG